MQIAIIAFSLLFSFNVVQAQTQPGPDYFHYRYELVSDGLAPYLLTIEGDKNENFEKGCSYDSVQKKSTCTGTIDSTIIMNDGSVFIRGGVNTGDIKLTIFEQCADKSELALTAIPAVIKRDWNDENGFFYLNTWLNLNPCHLPTMADPQPAK